MEMFKNLKVKIISKCKAKKQAYPKSNENQKNNIQCFSIQFFHSVSIHLSQIKYEIFLTIEIALLLIALIACIFFLIDGRSSLPAICVACLVADVTAVRLEHDVYACFPYFVIFFLLFGLISFFDIAILH